jgi:hypothetical protein
MGVLTAGRMHELTGTLANGYFEHPTPTVAPASVLKNQ